jgi:hypothetical protein
MKSDAEKVLLHAKPEGREEIWILQCDLYYPKEGPPVAVLDWGSDMELLDGQYVPLRPELLIESKRSGIAYEYQNHSEPIRFPKGLADWKPAGLTQDAFRKGFFRVE